MKLTTTKDRLPDVLAAIKALTKSEVLIGVPHENAPRSDAEDAARKASGEPITNAEIGYINEFGSPEVNIPARPHLIPGVESVKDKVASILGNGARKALSGDPGAAQTALTKAGLAGETAVKDRINEGPHVPLAPATLAARRRRGRTGEKPLVDTGQYRNSITHVVRPKGGE